jgi:molybdopterin converting factor small subunit
MALILIPAPYRPYTDGASELAVQVKSVAQAVDVLLDRHPGLRPHLLNPQGKLRPFVNLFVNGTHIKDLGGQATPLEESDVLRIVPSIAGGEH